MANSNALIIAHRGESFDAPENTLAAINRAWDKGAKCVEVDIHLTKDNHIVVIHDYDTLRVSGEMKIIKESNFDEIKRLKIISEKGGKQYCEHIPLLQEVLQTVPLHGKIIIEIKSDKAILKELEMQLSKSGLKDHQIEIIAFDFNVLALAKLIMPQYKMLWLLDLDYKKNPLFIFINKQKIITKVITHKLDGVNVWAGKLLNIKFISKFKNYGLLVYCWTVNDLEHAQKLLKAGIDGITTDRACWLSERLK